MAGEILAGKYHKLSCARHLKDRSREGASDFPYRFVWEERDEKGKLKPCAVRFLRFASRMKHYKGKKWAGTYFQPSDCQVFRLGALFGWRRLDTGDRRFTTSYNELPRKNGKSFEAGIVGVYCTFFEGEAGAEGYIIATKRDQANIVFRVSRQLVRKSREGSRVLSRIVVRTHALYRESNESTLQPLGADYDSTDGLNPSLIVTDEMHAMKNRGLMDVMETAIMNRENPLNFQITTAGNDPMTPCGQQHDYACKILDGVLSDESTESFFAFIAHADPDDDPFAETTMRKANPHYGGSVDAVELRKIALKAKHMPEAAPAYKQKNLNLWVNTLAPWLSLDGWRKGQSRWTLESMRNERCWVGVDLSSKIDLAAAAFGFEPTEARKHWRFFVQLFSPADTLLERAHRDRAPYDRWAAAGHIRTNPGNRLDQDLIRDTINEFGEIVDIQSIGFDPWNAGNIEKDLQEDGYEVLEIPQTMNHMSAPAKEFEADVLDGHVDCGDNPALRWMASNVVVQRDGKDNIYPTKKKSRGRIDGIIACVIARKLARMPTKAEPSYQMLIVGAP